ncbi:bifunctional homocysteine S-methyltransferase/methylenetetrahydrofolate reductase [Bacillus sp. ISL-40]|uniref:bifunctional homocysteine S-methyltransferase/methylenetetrahydrofolate reductase n=1 Tax=unclassified Bacillus (in: firmicutes) TaxID=185979 RepID=UPI001BEC5DD9|nr:MULTISPECIES: bifunctional homocysteine S-methyltransferase/methylenetetrahydrofolate reductase [unclassified Bacillus (in: firmicutes)]MBT2699478.1 bifunctional homocysteine S-methyltransferase/methylenetetrahydrofolate reductase [Bacillus sp. ISL-40]MBT2722009.1 bifunctional homocysteine S-methyltransferase/methylenetetrahydrofolate reductase [Bacillus sp. ISL-46]MBT2741643.1 bifunctional homocysteine S-methyltransferase/methylenetetrahydrofolate reductase [Bacillus sp. ISL-77]
MSFLDKLKNQILIADGAMGTLLYSFGKDSCLEELNLSQPGHIQTIHKAYIDAGADVIQTNTYAANYLKLQRYGLEDSVKEINSAAVSIAKKAAAQNDTYVLGTIGGNRGIKPDSISIEELKRSFREQLYCLLLEGVDGLLLETFYDFEELETVLTIARKETKLPIIAQVSHQEPGLMQDRTPVNDALKRLEGLGADVVGLNCRLGPHHMLLALEQIELPAHAFLSAYPNASLPAYTDGKFHYEGDANYFQNSAKAFRNQGVRLLGGCCGTTPDHIRAYASELKNSVPVTEKIVKLKPKKIIVESLAPKREFTPLQELVKERPSVIVELDPPRKLDTTKFFQGAKALKEAGIDSITLADNSLATVRISNESLGYLVKQDLGMRPLIHIACRDRNIIGLQSHLMGLHTLGMNDVLAITGDPARVGDFPGASSVYDVSSFELIQMIKQLNEGLSFSGKDLGQKTDFSIAAAFNPNVRSLEKAVKRLEKKVHYGADYFISQPVFSEEKLLEVYEHTKHLDAPIYIGLMPLISSKNAEFLHNEVPGIKIADSIRQRMAQLNDQPLQAAREGIAITKSLIDAALDLFNGIYLITPFLRYELTAELALYTRQRASELRGSNYAENTIF